MNTDSSERNITAGIVVVDLDGTLVSVNTWPCFARFLLRAALRRRRFLVAVHLAWKLLLRKLRAVSHLRVKRIFMLRSAAILRPEDLEAFADMMARRFNPEVMALLEEARLNKGSHIVLATAAAGEYAPLIGSRAGIADILCTPAALPGRPYKECRGERKADAVEQLAHRLSLPVAMVITDHSDDFPLFRRFPEARHILIK